MPLQDSYIQSRADTMQNIESTIVELGSIFQQLAHMVKEQEETIQRLEAARIGVEKGLAAIIYTATILNHFLQMSLASDFPFSPELTDLKGKSMTVKILNLFKA